MIPRRGALGLRGRIVGAVLVTTVATLVVAALALLGPLEHSLRRAALTTLLTEVKGAQANFANIPFDYEPPGNAPAPTTASGIATEMQREARTLRGAQLKLGQHIGATVLVFGFPAPGGKDFQVLAPPPDSDAVAQAPRDLIYQAFHSGQAQSAIRSYGDTEYAMATIPFSNVYKTPKEKILREYVLSVTKPIDDSAAVAAVQTAFVYAALAGLALTLLLAIPLSLRIVRRLRRLREAALELTREGPVVDMPHDRARDEVGDLARTFGLMQVQLRQQEEARRAFVATASHELRTPLTSLEGMLELLQEDLSDEHPDLDDAREMLGRARAQSHRLGRLAADLLDLSRLDAQVQLRSEPVELSELSRAVLAEFELGTSERDVHCELADGAGPVWALGDPGSVARILRILIDNAMRVTPPGASIHVELETGDNALLRVCDEGPGVAEADRDKIFQRFYRGPNTSGQAGFGLGLAIGRELAQRMGGELVLEASSSAGATFALRLPMASAPEHDTLALR